MELGAEISNLRQAWRWAGEKGHIEQISQAADTFCWFYESRSNSREGVPLFEYVAHSIGRDTHSDEAGTASALEERHRLVFARVIAYQGFLHLRQGQYRQARELLHRSLSFLQTMTNQASYEAHFAFANTNMFLGMVYIGMGDYSRGRSHMEEGLALMRKLNDRWGESICLRQLGLLAYYQGQLDEASLLLNESLIISRELGNFWIIAFSLNFLGMTTYARGLHSEAEKLLQEARILAQQVGHRYSVAYALNGLGLVKHALGNFAEASHLLAESIAIWREIGDQANLAHSLNTQAGVLLEINSLTEAHKNYLEALGAARNASLVPLMLDALLGNAILRAHQGRTESALKLLTHIKDHPAGVHATRKRAERLYSELCSTAIAERTEVMNYVHSEHEFNRLVDEVLNN
jgi:tetratricopeptide (TPR) repeat protein